MRSFAVLATAALLAVTATPVDAQLGAERWYFTPQFGFSASSELSSGVHFGLTTAYMINPSWGIGPVFEFTTAGRQFETGGGDLARKTEASSALILGARASYHFTEGSETTWRFHFGGAWMRHGAIQNYQDGARIAFNEPTPGFGLVRGEISSVSRLAATFGVGTFLPMSDQSRIALDLNFYASTVGERTGVTERGTEIDLNERLDGGVFWLTQVSIGFHLGH